MVAQLEEDVGELCCLLGHVGSSRQPWVVGAVMKNQQEVVENDTWISEIHVLKMISLQKEAC